MTRVDLTEFLDAYLGEADELLATANAQLLAIDPLQRRGESTARQVRDLFRALHTIKGLSAMVGVEPIVAIAHRMEGALRSTDRAGGALPPGAVDLLFQGIRAIEQRVASLAAGRDVADAPDGLLDAIEHIDPGPSVRPPAAARIPLDPELDTKLAPFDRAALAEGVRGGRRAICARFAPSPALVAAGTTITTVRERLATVAEIVKVLPVALAASPTTPAGLGFVLLALTTETNDAVARAIGVAPEGITTLAEAALPAPSVTPEPVDGLLGDEDDSLDPRTSRHHVRVDVERLDEALEGLSALIVGRASLVHEVARMAEREVDVRGLQILLREQQRQVRTLRAAILRLRMVPVNDVLKRVPLILRAWGRTSGRTVRLEIDVGRAELDKSVAERIFPAIVHLVRNAADHAIESPDERIRAGKLPDGLIRIVCRARGNGRLDLQVTDDGRGVDAARLAERAGQPIPATAGALLQLLCRAGLSSRVEANATSGRGMGMDIVRKAVEELGGDLSLETEVGVGTSFTLCVPQTISIVDAFTFECGGQRFVVPLSTIDEIVEIDGAAVVRPPGHRTSAGSAEVGLIERRGEVVPLIRLDAVFGLAASTGERAGSRALIVRREGEAMAFAVDRLLGQQEIVVRPLADPLLVAPGISGATDLGDGRPTLVIDLLALGARFPRPSPGAGP